MLKIGIFTLVLASIFFKSHALVTAPFVAVGALKIAVFFVSLVSVPVIWFFQIIHKHKKLRGLLISLLVLIVIFLIVFLSVNIYRRYY